MRELGRTEGEVQMGGQWLADLSRERLRSGLEVDFGSRLQSGNFTIHVQAHSLGLVELQPAVHEWGLHSELSRAVPAFDSSRYFEFFLVQDAYIPSDPD
jgi:hypothetical protein